VFLKWNSINFEVLSLYYPLYASIFLSLFAMVAVTNMLRLFRAKSSEEDFSAKYRRSKGGGSFDFAMIENLVIHGLKGHE